MLILGTENVSSANYGTTVTFLLRIVGVTQALITNASVGSISRRRVMANTSTLESGTNLTPISDYVYDTPQTDEGWQFPTQGYNFKDRVTMDAIGTMRIIYTFVDSNNMPTVVTLTVDVNSVP